MTLILDPERPLRITTPLRDCPMVVIDFETTGIDASARAVEVALCRFENGQLVDTDARRLDPGIPIPEEASRIHGIYDDDVRGCPDVATYFTTERSRELLRGAAPAAYNADYDRQFMPWAVLTDVLSPRWPWLDPMVWVRDVDRFLRGAGKNKLENACRRRGIDLVDAHAAAADAQAAGELMVQLAAETENAQIQIGRVLQIQADLAAIQWLDFEHWKDRQIQQASQARP